jgi:hypothetical protein
MKNNIDNTREHAHWELDPDGVDWDIPAWVCSKCGFRNSFIPVKIDLGNGMMLTVEDPTVYARTRYCPNCGARMDEPMSEKEFKNLKKYQIFTAEGKGPQEDYSPEIVSEYVKIEDFKEDSNHSPMKAEDSEEALDKYLDSIRDKTHGAMRLKEHGYIPNTRSAGFVWNDGQDYRYLFIKYSVGHPRL